MSGPRGTCTLISGVRSRRLPVGPAAQFLQRFARDLNPAFLLTKEECHPNTCRPQVIPDGLEPSLPGCGPGVFAAGPRDQTVTEVGIEPTIVHQALERIATISKCRKN